MSKFIVEEVIPLLVTFVISCLWTWFLFDLKQYLPPKQWRALLWVNLFLLLVLCINLNLGIRVANGLEVKRTDKPQQLITDLPILLSVYDTALCEPNTPCLQSDGDGYFATMLPVSGEWYGKMAACPPKLLGSTIVIPYLEIEVYCGDNFGSLNGVPVETVVWGNDGYVRVDVFYPVAEQGLPEWNYWKVEGWNYEWR